MTRPFRELDELLGLLDALCEESITPQQVRRLEELVLTHPEAEAYYVQYMSLTADLVGHFAAPVGPKIEERGSTELAPERSAILHPRSRVSSAPRLLISLSALAAAVLLALALWPRPPAPQLLTPRPEATDSTVAVLLRTSAAQWEQTELPTRTLGPLQPGWLRLKSGFAHVEFYCGAVVILEGPVEFQLISRTEAYCASGKVRVTVPPHAQGFTIGTPKLDLIDRGTEFGLDIKPGGRTEVHVFKGWVELFDPGADRKSAKPRKLERGEGVRLDGPGGPGGAPAIPVNPAAFPTAQYLATRSLAETRQRQKEWLAASEALRKDRTLEVYYSFRRESQWSRTLANQVHDRPEPRDGAIVGCSWATGRWPGKQGLEFKRVSDRVRLNVAGEFESITLMAWVRVDGLPNRNNSLLMADGWEPGELHWQIGDNGTLILGVQSDPKGRGAHYHALEAITPERCGHWLHLAVVYDRNAGQVTHYIDGQPVAQVPTQFDIPLRVGDAELGNWNLASHRNNTPIRHFTGCMDEFLFYSRALTDEEVAQRYAEGRPP
ncbi:MAG: hypothetical protein L0Z62_44565 [Gemmataceae bacterium]|nr:hypothetical protein [Gemmataceae bacterium]